MENVNTLDQAKAEYDEAVKLENCMTWVADPPLAAMKIYDASCPGFKINPARFFDSNENALADMKRMAGQSAAQGPNT